MLTRREMLIGPIAAGVLMHARPALPAAPTAITAVNFAVPDGACDCHTHIFGDPKKFPFSPARVYTPEPALPDELALLHQSLHMQRVVVVTPSVYGTDNASTLYGIRARGADARGIAVIDEKTLDSELDALHQGGIRGIRLNLATNGINDPAAVRQRLQAAVDRVKQRNWHVQIYIKLPLIAAIKELVLAAPVPVVFDHFAGAEAELGPLQPGFVELVELLRSGRAYVKISGAYRASQSAPDYSNVVPLAKALIAANPDRILWGTDWPHPDVTMVPGRKPTDVAPRLAIDDGQLLNELAIWAPGSRIRQKILVDNPARLYSF